MRVGRMYRGVPQLDRLSLGRGVARTTIQILDQLK